MKLFKRLACAIVVFTLLAATLSAGQAATESLTIQAGEEKVKTLNLLSGDHVRIAFTALSDSYTSFRFYIIFPNGTAEDYEEDTNYPISFISDVGGECELHFDNSNSPSSKLVTINYEIEHYYFGLPEIPFLMIVIVLLLLCIMAGYIIMGKYS